MLIAALNGGRAAIACRERLRKLELKGRRPLAMDDGSRLKSIGSTRARWGETSEDVAFSYVLGLRGFNEASPGGSALKRFHLFPSICPLYRIPHIYIYTYIMNMIC